MAGPGGGLLPLPPLLVPPPGGAPPAGLPATPSIVAASSAGALLAGGPSPPFGAAARGHLVVPPPAVLKANRVWLLRVPLQLAEMPLPCFAELIYPLWVPNANPSVSRSVLLSSDVSAAACAPSSARAAVCSSARLDGHLSSSVYGAAHGQQEHPPASVSAVAQAIAPLVAAHGPSPNAALADVAFGVLLPSSGPPCSY